MESNAAKLLEGRAAAGDLDALLTLAGFYDGAGEIGKAREWLTRGVAAGDPRAKAAFGRSLIGRQPFDALKGVEWTRAAASEGDPDASHLMAMLSAAGLGMQQNWMRAFDYLEAAAESGSAMARTSLAVLAGEWDLAKDPSALAANGNWQDLRDRIDVQTWLDAPEPRIVSNSPRIFSCEGFFRPEVCNRLIELGRPHLKRAETFSNANGMLSVEAARSNSAAQIPLLHTDMVLTLMRAKIAAYSGLPAIGFEDSTVLHYAPGQEYRAHVDYFDPRLPVATRELATLGQRVLTCLVYLNDDFDGGDTFFPRINRGFKGKKGEAIMFWNVLPDMLPDPMSLHAGRAPVSGEKWLFSQWIRLRNQ